MGDWTTFFKKIEIYKTIEGVRRLHKRRKRHAINYYVTIEAVDWYETLARLRGIEKRCVIGFYDTMQEIGFYDTIQAIGFYDTMQAVGFYDTMQAIGFYDTMQAIGFYDKMQAIDFYETMQADRLHKTTKGSWIDCYETMQEKMSDERRKERGANKISTFADLADIFSPYHSRLIQRGSFGSTIRSFSYFEDTGHENERHTMQKMSDERRKERDPKKILAIAEHVDVNLPDYSSKFKRGIFSLCSQFLPCAGGSNLEDSQHKQQIVNGIYQHTLGTVSHCPSVSDYIQRANDKCAEVCTNNIQDDGCSYHCMRDSYKTSLVEFCAKPKFLFDFCPEYDSIGQTIQKDIYTLCKHSNPLPFYRSSDIFFCDQGNCLQLRDAGVSTGVTSLMTDTTPVSGDLNESWLSQNWYVVLLSGVTVTCIVFGCIFYFRQRLIAFFRKLTKRGNPNNVQDDNEQAALHNEA